MKNRQRDHDTEAAGAAVGALMGILLSDLAGLWTTVVWAAGGGAVGFVAGAVIAELLES